jgi:hypothetical protein
VRCAWRDDGAWATKAMHSGQLLLAAPLATGSWTMWPCWTVARTTTAATTRAAAQQHTIHVSAREQGEYECMARRRGARHKGNALWGSCCQRRQPALLHGHWQLDRVAMLDRRTHHRRHHHQGSTHDTRAST